MTPTEERLTFGNDHKDFIVPPQNTAPNNKMSIKNRNLNQKEMPLYNSNQVPQKENAILFDKIKKK